MNRYKLYLATLLVVALAGVAWAGMSMTPVTGAPATATYYTATTDGVLSNEIVLLWADGLAYDVKTSAAALDPQNGRVVVDDFLTANGCAAAGAGASYQFGVTWTIAGAAPCTTGSDRLLIRGDGTNSARASMLLNGALATVFDPVTNGGVFKVRWSQVTATAGTRRVGLAIGHLTADTTGIYFRHTAGGNIFGVCRNGGAESTVDSGIAAGAGVFHTGMFSVNIITGAVSFWFDTATNQVGSAQTIAGGGNCVAAAMGVTAGAGVVTNGVGLDLDYVKYGEARL